MSEGARYRRYAPYGASQPSMGYYSISNRQRRPPGQLQRAQAIHPHDVSAMQQLVRAIASEAGSTTPSSGVHDNVGSDVSSVATVVATSDNNAPSYVASGSACREAESFAPVMEILRDHSRCLMKIVQVLVSVQKDIAVVREQIGVVRECLDSYESDSDQEVVDTEPVVESIDE